MRERVGRPYVHLSLTLIGFAGANCGPSLLLPEPNRPHLEAECVLDVYGRLWRTGCKRHREQEGNR